MVPGRKYTAESLLRLLRQRALVIVMLGIIGGSAAAAYIWRVPNVYRAQATLLVRPQVVPQAYVRSTVTSDIDDLVRTLTERVLSAESMSAIVSELNVNGGPRPSPQLLAAARAGVDIDIVRGDAFTVGFFDREPAVAARMANRLARAFTDENLRSRTGLAEETDQFLDEQLRATRDRLDEQLKQLENYRRTYAGQLPSQLEANLQVLSSAQQQLQATTDAIQTDVQQKIRLEQNLDALNEADTAEPAPVVPSEPPPALDPFSEQVMRLRGRDALQQLPEVRRNLQQLELQLKPGHPDIVKLKSVIAVLEQRVVADLGPDALKPPVKNGAAERRRSADTIRAQIRAIDARIAERRGDETQLRATLTRYQQRVEAIPTRETELTALMRDYETVRESYQTLLKKREEAQLAAELERRRVGETLYVGVRPVVPTRPYSPRRSRFVATGAVAGLMLGLVLVAWREFRDTTLRTEAEVVSGLELPVLAVVPAIAAPLESRRRWVRAGASLAGLLVAGIAVALYLGLWPRL